MNRSRIAVVTGGCQGLGLEISKNLNNRGIAVISLAISLPNKEDAVVGIRNIICDVSNAKEIFDCAQQVPVVDILINNAGINKINYLDNLVEADWDSVLGVNAKAIYLVTKQFLNQLKQSRGIVVNIISNAYRIPMTASLAYNASKGAAYIMTKQLARELTKKYGVTVFGVAPNKLEGTGMSKYIEKRTLEVRSWTEEYAKEYQSNSIVCGEETDPVILADFIGYLVSEKERCKYLSGCILEYGD